MVACCLPRKASKDDQQLRSMRVLATEYNSEILTELNKVSGEEGLVRLASWHDIEKKTEGTNYRLYVEGAKFSIQNKVEFINLAETNICLILIKNGKIYVAEVWPGSKFYVCE